MCSFEVGNMSLFQWFSFHITHKNNGKPLSQQVVRNYLLMQVQFLSIEWLKLKQIIDSNHTNLDMFHGKEVVSTEVCNSIQ